MVEVETGDGHSVVDDDGLGGDLVGDDGAVVVGIADDNVVDVEDGGVDGLALDGSVLSLGDAFTLTGCDGPISIENGGLEVLDLDELDDEALQDIVDQIDLLLGDLLGAGGDDVLNIDDLLDGDLGDLFDDLLGGLL